VREAGPQDAVTAHFDAYAVGNRWGELYNPRNPDSYSFLARRRKAVELLGDLRGTRILDIGCGSGALVEPLLAADVRYDGVDIAPTMVAEATRHIRELGAEDRFHVHLGSGLSIPFGADQFDAVVGMGYLEYFDEPEPVIREAMRVVKPGGRLIFTIPQKVSFDLWAVRATSALRGVARQITGQGARTIGRNRYTPAEFKALFEQAGCRVVDERFYNKLLLPYPFTRFVPGLANRVASMVEDTPGFEFFATGYILACEK
jgi:ubiquinone/menaquinone biosynthesis C-methylase UbiE